jgi:hypothetical protein
MDTVEIHGDTWRYADIQEDVEWCRTREWKPAKYRTSGEHSHCQVCWWSLRVSDDPDVAEGYVSSGKVSLWLCSECFAQFVASDELSRRQL